MESGAVMDIWDRFPYDGRETEERKGKENRKTRRESPSRGARQFYRQRMTGKGLGNPRESEVERRMKGRRREEEERERRRVCGTEGRRSGMWVGVLANQAQTRMRGAGGGEGKSGNQAVRQPGSRRCLCRTPNVRVGQVERRSVRMYQKVR